MKGGQDDEEEKTSAQEREKNGVRWKTIEVSILEQQNDLPRWPRQRVDAYLLRSQGAQSDRAARL